MKDFEKNKLIQSRAAHDWHLYTYATYTDWEKKCDVINNFLFGSVESLDTFQHKNLHVRHKVLKIQEDGWIEEVSGVNHHFFFQLCCLRTALFLGFFFGRAVY